ncbi:MAG: thioredoxin-dependent thiol peroxidase [Deltaproteobacteria bacterium]|nr:thioredoxin-dependent thiol peroxidase [Deltaproteobacteria bacterium]
MSVSPKSTAPLSIGSKAPPFSLTDQSGVSHSLRELKDDFVVLFFYPKDNTPGCTLEAQEFTALKESFRKQKSLIVGISGGTDRTKASFCKKFDLDVLLLSDTDFAVSTSYGVYGEKKFMGRKYLGIHRTTFVVNRDRRIAHVFESVKPQGHAEDVLGAIRALRK